MDCYRAFRGNAGIAKKGGNKSPISRAIDGTAIQTTLVVAFKSGIHREERTTRHYANIPIGHPDAFGQCACSL